MIPYKRHTLSNGLTVAVNRDRQSKLAAVNILYKVGARNEDPARTGFAHLFEHLMFRGTRDVPDFDLPVQMACGDNNAFTNNDYTDFYITLPKDNIETALWLEADRMDRTRHHRPPSARSREERVVIEEYQPALPQPALRRPGECCCGRWPTPSTPTAGRPSAWRPTISPEPRSTDVRVLLPRATTARRTPFCRSRPTSRRSGCWSWPKSWFAPLADHPSADGPPSRRNPCRHRPRRQEVERDVPASTVTVAYHMCARTKRRISTPPTWFRTCSRAATRDASTRTSSKNATCLSSVNAYITGDVDPGLFVFTGQLLPGVTARSGRSGFPRRDRSPANDRRDRIRNRKGQEQIRSQHALRRTERDEQGDEPRVTTRCWATSPSINREVDRYRAVTDERHPLASAAARCGPKTVPHSFTTPGNDTTPHTRPPQVEVARSPPHARCPTASDVYTLASDDFEVLRITLRLPRRIGRPAGAKRSSPRRPPPTCCAEGTRDMTAQQIAEQLDYYGSWYDVNVDRDYAYINFCHPLEILRPDARRGGTDPAPPRSSPRRSCASYAAQSASSGWRIERTKVDDRGPRGLRPRAFRALRHPYGISWPEDSLRQTSRATTCAGFYRTVLHRPKTASSCAAGASATTS